MKIQLEKRDGLVHNTNLTILAKALYKALDKNDLLHQNADDFMVINTIFDTVQELPWMGIKDE
tara:strand:+ start:3270 stop:3458 length:189 start_codon:yes stop_codon:yes gene_type:complete